MEAEHEEEASAIVSGNSGREVTPVSGEADVAHDDCQDSDAGASGVQEKAVVQEEAVVQDASRTGLMKLWGMSLSIVLPSRPICCMMPPSCRTWSLSGL